MRHALADLEGGGGGGEGGGGGDWHPFENSKVRKIDKAKNQNPEEMKKEKEK